MDFNQLMGKLGRTGIAFAAGGLLMFIDSFFPWFSVSIKGALGFPGASGSTNGWSSGIGAWFPILLLLAVGVVTVLAAMGVINWSYLMLVTLGTGASVLSVLIILLRWLTYPSVPSELTAYESAGAGAGTYIGLVVALAMAVLGYLGFVAAGGSLSNIPAAFKPQEQIPPQQPPYPPQG
jgi:hypothetical protein